MIGLLLLLAQTAPAQAPAQKTGDFGSLRDEHRVLAKLAGDFTVKQKEIDEQGKVEEELSGVMKRTVILDGRYLQEETTLEGKKAQTKNLVLLGFDARKGKFVSLTVNNQSTITLITEGIWEKDKKQITFVDEEFDPVTKKLLSRTREVYRFVSDDEQVFEEYLQLGDKPEYRSLEIRYQRKK